MKKLFLTLIVSSFSVHTAFTAQAGQQRIHVDRAMAPRAQALTPEDLNYTEEGHLVLSHDLLATLVEIKKHGTDAIREVLTLGAGSVALAERIEQQLAIERIQIECQICHEGHSAQETVFLACHHTLGAQCLQNMLAQNPANTPCPTCRWANATPTARPVTALFPFTQSTIMEGLRVEFNNLTAQIATANAQRDQARNAAAQLPGVQAERAGLIRRFDEMEAQRDQARNQLGRANTERQQAVNLLGETQRRVTLLEHEKRAVFTPKNIGLFTAGVCSAVAATYLLRK